MSASSQLIPIILSLIAAVLGAMAQWFYKVGAMRLWEVAPWKNWHLMAGVASFTAVLILFIAAFRLGGRLFTVYPAYATTYVWGGLIAYYWEGEAIGTAQMIGVSLIIAGVGFISYDGV
jgi:drug/metabolite transporter (DMT)-like permease